MKVVALVSGGKDSCFSMMECVRHGHEIVALANLRPPAEAAGDPEELDSFMFQTVGVGAICPAIAECMGLPLVTRTLRGKSVHQDLDYRAVVGGDEVEDLFALLQEVKERFPEVDAVCSGAILSNYQRNRVEFVCDRLGLTSLAFLWQREQHEVLTSMIDGGLEAVMVKIASMGLKPRMLGQPLAALLGEFEDLNDQFGFHVCGEGGEYETVTLDCPLFSRRIVLDDVETLVEDDCSFAPCAHLRIRALHTEPKEADSPNQAPIAPAHYLTRTEALVAATSADSPEPVDQGEAPLVSRSPQGGLVSVQNCVGDASESLEAELRGAMAKLADALVALDMQVDGHVCFVHLYVGSMDDFGRVNAEYCKYFSSAPAPSRACVQVGLPAGRRVMVCALATPQARDVLHVRSISLWAPVCIGPYSQANTVGDLGALTFVAGQIPLEPAVMEMIAGDEAAQLEKSLKHCSAVLQCRSASMAHVRSLVLYVSSAATCKLDKLLDRLPKEAAVTIVRIPRLPRDALVEVEVLAAAAQGQAASTMPASLTASGSFRIQTREVVGAEANKAGATEDDAPVCSLHVLQLGIFRDADAEDPGPGEVENAVAHVQEVLGARSTIAGRVFYAPHDASSAAFVRALAPVSALQAIACSELATSSRANGEALGAPCAVVVAFSFQM